MTTYQPTYLNRATFYRGGSAPAWAVWAFQQNLWVTKTGVFDLDTDKAVRAWQTAHRLEVDGVAGPLTQRSICLVRSSPAQTTYRTPGGLLRGIIEGESGFSIACTSGVAYDGGRDYGAYQDHLPPPVTQEQLARAFNVGLLAEDTAAKLRRKRDEYYPRVTGLSAAMRARYLDSIATDPLKLAWCLAVLYHNWPVGADRLSYGKPASTSGDDVRLQWVVDIGGPWTTARQWYVHYVLSKVQYVRSWGA